MKLINKDTDYAVKALVSVAQKSEGRITVSGLAKETDIPGPFLRKIFQTLNKEGILESSKGKGGGFRLAIPPERIFLTRIIQIFQGPIKLNECLFKKKFCSDMKICPLKKKIESLEDVLLAELAATTIGSLAKEIASEKDAIRTRKNPEEGARST
jgi:Rrf2 family protein